MFLHESIDLFSQSAAVERFTFGAGNFTKRFSHVVVLKDIAWAQPRIIRCKSIKPALKLGAIAIFAVIFVSFFPQAADVGRNGIAVFCVINGRSHHFFQRQTAEAFVHGHPTAYSTRYIDRFDTVGRNAFKAAFFEFSNGGCHG